MKDCFGNTLSVGDKVYFVKCDYADKFRYMDMGVIEKITECKVLIKDTNNKYRFGYNGNRKYDNRTYRNPDRVIKM